MKKYILKSATRSSFSHYDKTRQKCTKLSQLNILIELIPKDNFLSIFYIPYFKRKVLIYSDEINLTFNKYCYLINFKTILIFY